MERITITRIHLYEQVWQQPMTRLAKTYGLSDVGLAKLCRKHNIPRPPRGYWAKKEFGHRPRKAGLPDPDNNWEVMEYCPQRREPLDPDREQDSREAGAEPREEELIEVSDSLRGAHKLVSKANQELTGARKDREGILNLPEAATLEIRVSKAQLRRALLIMDAVLKALDRRGHPVAAGPTVTILEQEVTFRITEQLETVREQPEEHDLDGPYQFGHSRFLQKRVPSGRLELNIPSEQLHWIYGCRKSWRDGKKQKIEDRLNSFVNGLEIVGEVLRERERAKEQERKQEAEAEKRRAEEARVRAEQRKRQEAERNRLNALLQQVDNWRKSQDISAFVEAVREAHLSAGLPIQAGSNLDGWLSWAMDQANRLDPLQESPPSILDEEIPEEPRRYTWER